MSIVADRLSEVIVECGLSHRELEDITGISRTTIYRYANKLVKKIPLDAVKSIAQATHTNPYYLMGWEDDPQEKTIDDQIMSLVSSLDDDQKQALLNIAKQLNKNN